MNLINLITGKKRNLLKNLESISNCQISNFKNYNFFVFWDNDDLTSNEKNIVKKKFKNSYFLTVDSNIYKKKFYNLIKDKHFHLNLRKIISDSYFQYSILQLAFIYASKILKKKSLQISHGQRIRSDIFVERKIKYNPVNDLLLPCSINGYGICDFHCIGPHKTFKIYCDLIHTITDLFKLNIFESGEVLLRMHLIRHNIKSVLTEKIPAALIKNENKIKLRNNYATTRGSKYFKSLYSKNISEKDFKFINYILLRKIYYYCYNIIIKLKINFS